MPNILAEVMRHKLHISLGYKPVKQKPRQSAPQKAKAVEEQVQRLLKTEAIRETEFLEWISNPVVIQKKNGKWRVFKDFTDPNKVCPKDSFSLPRIDQLVDSTAGHK